MNMVHLYCVGHHSEARPQCRRKQEFQVVSSNTRAQKSTPINQRRGRLRQRPHLAAISVLGQATSLEHLYREPPRARGQCACWVIGWSTPVARCVSQSTAVPETAHPPLSRNFQHQISSWLPHRHVHDVTLRCSLDNRRFVADDLISKPSHPCSATAVVGTSSLGAFCRPSSLAYVLPASPRLSASNV